METGKIHRFVNSVLYFSYLNHNTAEFNQAFLENTLFLTEKIYAQKTREEFSSFVYIKTKTGVRIESNYLAKTLNLLYQQRKLDLEESLTADPKTGLFIRDNLIKCKKLSLNFIEKYEEAYPELKTIFQYWAKSYQANTEATKRLIFSDPVWFNTPEGSILTKPSLAKIDQSNELSSLEYESLKSQSKQGSLILAPRQPKQKIIHLEEQQDMDHLEQKKSPLTRYIETQEPSLVETESPSEENHSFHAESRLGRYYNNQRNTDFLLQNSSDSSIDVLENSKEEFIPTEAVEETASTHPPSKEMLALAEIQQAYQNRFAEILKEDVDIKDKIKKDSSHTKPSTKDRLDFAKLSLEDLVHIIATEKDFSLQAKNYVHNHYSYAVIHKAILDYKNFQKLLKEVNKGITQSEQVRTLTPDELKIKKFLAREQKESETRFDNLVVEVHSRLEASKRWNNNRFDFMDTEKLKENARKEQEKEQGKKTKNNKVVQIVPENPRSIDANQLDLTNKFPAFHPEEKITDKPSLNLSPFSRFKMRLGSKD